MPLMALPLRPLMYQDIFKSSNFFSPDAASIHMYLVNPACESALQSGNVWICYEFGIVWMLNPDIFLSGDVTRSSPGLYHEYCIQDGNLIPRFSQGRARCKFCALVFTTHALLPIFPAEFWVLEWSRIRVGYVWTGKSDLTTDTCERGNFWIRKEKGCGYKNIRMHVDGAENS